MGKVVFLKLEKGDFSQGFPVALNIAEEGRFPHVFGVSGSLRQAPEIPEAYRDWQTKYCNLESSYRYRRQRLHVIKATTSDEGDSEQERFIRECQEAAERLKANFQTWLQCDEFRVIETELLTGLSQSDEIRVFLLTEDELLRKLPWEDWNFFHRFPNAGFGISPPTYRSQRNIANSKKVRILAILGNSDGIDTEKDRKVLESLPDAEVCFLVEPTRRQFKRLWDDRWDILFFAGHSSSQDGERGYIYINRTNEGRLEISEVEETLKTAITNGLKLAIFNSCDGLGLARQLEKLDIPQIIVMREPIPDKIAQDFLKYFLTSFSRGMSSYTSVRRARKMLQELSELKEKFPGASWLPVICQNPATKDFVWPSPPPPPWRVLAESLRQYSWAVMLVALVGSAIAFITVKQSPIARESCSATEKKEAGHCFKDLSKTGLVIAGLMSPYENLTAKRNYQYGPLENYLKKELGNQVKDIRSEFGKELSYQNTKSKIANHDWDIVFAHSPMNSWAAKSYGYTWLARKEENKTHYRSVLFVRTNSPIRTIADIKTTTKVALGHRGSASSFNVPVYELYGKSLKVDLGNSYDEIKRLVKSGEAEVGASQEGDVLGKPEFRIIHRSRAIPVAGIFISPKLSKSDQKQIQNILVQATKEKEIRETAYYQPSEELDYEHMGKTEKLLECIGFNLYKNPAQLFCKK